MAVKLLNANVFQLVANFVNSAITVGAEQTMYSGFIKTVIATAGNETS